MGGGGGGGVGGGGEAVPTQNLNRPVTRCAWAARFDLTC